MPHLEAPACFSRCSPCACLQRPPRLPATRPQQAQPPIPLCPASNLPPQLLAWQRRPCCQRFAPSRPPLCAATLAAMAPCPAWPPPATSCCSSGAYHTSDRGVHEASREDAATCGASGCSTMKHSARLRLCGVPAPAQCCSNDTPLVPFGDAAGLKMPSSPSLPRARRPPRCPRAGSSPSPTPDT